MEGCFGRGLHIVALQTSRQPKRWQGSRGTQRSQWGRVLERVVRWVARFHAVEHVGKCGEFTRQTCVRSACV
eukprot:scaffold3728_cov417-Prasinococcus_capsulatus_cf.AAC.3